MIKFFLPIALLVVGCSRQTPELNLPSLARAFVGTEQCSSCHLTQFKQWQGSHHQLAMQPANNNTVLGDFSGQQISYFDTETSFFKRSGEFFARTQNAAGEDEEFKITHTFGVSPLQQYLVDMSGGRKQALQFAWDSRHAANGGQRWYHLYPDEYLGPSDPLHWTGPYFNWNVMCAECHSTNVQLGYDVGTNSFDTSFDEISVGCEACHGPGSSHVAQANDDDFDQHFGLPVNLDDRADSTWIMNQNTGIAERSTPNTTKQQPESCGRCHSRRSVITSNYTYGAPLTQTHMPALLEENLYHADGRIQEEVYVYGSFIQSKMYAAGVTCSDCHNPHSGNLHAGPNPNDTCAQCHLPAVFKTAAHSVDKVGDCVSCHMPATTYMGVDDRRDHSFRLPDAGEDSAHYGQAIAAGRKGGNNPVLLTAISNEKYPAIARATMLTLLEPPTSSVEMAVIETQLSDPDPLVRIGALRALANVAPVQRGLTGSHLLRDENRGVRIEAAHTFVEQRDLFSLEDARAFGVAIGEFRDSLLFSASLPTPAVQLAELEARLGNFTSARKYFEHALRVGPDSALAHHAFGLFLVRTGEHDAALEHIRRAAVLEPTHSRFAYVYGVALNSLGQKNAAIEVLRHAREQFPGDFDISFALATMFRDSGNMDEARRVAAELQKQHPENSIAAELLKALR